MGHQRQYNSDARYARKHLREVAEIDEQQSAKAHDPFALSPNNILNLQRTIGNQAVQRLIRQADMLQRQPTDTQDSQKQTALPSVVASITGSRQGKFKGGRRIAGHEGKIEILSLSLEPSARENKMTVHLTKEVDDSSAAFMKALLAGEPLTSAQFDFIRRNEEGNIETVKTHEFNDGIITSIQHNGTGPVPTETITIEFTLKPEKE
jgi:type VI secretion system Hcp family effector